MYNAGSTYRNLIDTGIRGIWGSSVKKTSNEEIDVKKFSLSQPYMTSLSIGNVVSKCLSLELHESTTSLENETLTVSVSLEGTEIPIGKFDVYTQNDTSLTCYDCVKKTDTEYSSDLVYPTSLQSVLNEIGTKCGVTFEYIEVPSITISSAFNVSTFRDALKEVCKILGKNAIANRSGNIEFVWFKSSGIQVSADNQYSQEINSDTYTVGQFVCLNSNGDTVKSGTTGRVLSFKSDYVDSTRIAQIASSCSISYKGATIDMIGDPTIDVGDIISIQDLDGTYQTVAVMDNTFEFDGGCRNKINSYAKLANETYYGANSNIVSKVFDIQKSVDGLELELRTDYADKTYVDTAVNIATGEITSEITESVKQEVIQSVSGVYTLNIIADSGTTFGIDASNLTLHAILRYQNVDVTYTTDTSCFYWQRKSTDSASDFEWNKQKNRNGPDLVLTSDDLTRDCTMRCTVIIPKNVYLVDENGNNITGDDGNQIVCQIPEDTLICDIPIKESFTEYKTLIEQTARAINMTLSSSDGYNTNLSLTSKLVELITTALNINAITTFMNSAKDGSATVINGGAISCDDLSAISANIADWSIADGKIDKKITINGVIYHVAMQTADGSSTLNNFYVRHSNDGGNSWVYDFAVNYAGRVTMNNVDATGGKIGSFTLSDGKLVNSNNTLELDGSAGLIKTTNETTGNVSQLYNGTFQSKNTNSGSNAYFTPTGFSTDSSEGYSGFNNTNCYLQSAKQNYIMRFSTDYATAIAAYKNTTTDSSNVYVDSKGNFKRVASSSERYKKNLIPLMCEGLNPERLLNATIYQYEYNDGYITDPNCYNGIQIGFSADDLYKNYPVAVELDDEGNPEKPNDRILIPAMFELIKRQSERIDNLESILKEKGLM